MTGCGSRGAYLGHHKRKETPCAACLEAMRPIWAAVDKRRRRRRVELEAPCGTVTAYRRHLRRGEPIDDVCQAALITRGEWLQRRRRGSIPDIIVDYLETFDTMSMLELASMIRLRHTDIASDVIKRTVYRMLKDGRVTSRNDPEGRLLLEVA